MDVRMNRQVASSEDSPLYRAKTTQDPRTLQSPSRQKSLTGKEDHCEAHRRTSLSRLSFLPAMSGTDAGAPPDAGPDRVQTAAGPIAAGPGGPAPVPYHDRP